MIRTALHSNSHRRRLFAGVKVAGGFSKRPEGMMTSTRQGGVVVITIQSNSCGYGLYLAARSTALTVFPCRGELCMGKNTMNQARAVPTSMGPGMNM